MGKITSENHPVTPRPTVLMQEEIRHTEAEITDTLHSIEAKLAPARLKEQVKTKVVNGTVNTVVHLGYTMKRRPVPSAAIGVGLLWLLRRRAHKKAVRVEVPVRRVDLGDTIVEVLPKEMKKNPMKTMKKYVTLGRMAFAFFSVASAVMMRGKRAQQSLDRERYGVGYGEFGEHPARL
ncbi:hypothetical protein LPW11_14915 [Geomonas sp. RF6]|uniref:hypothetical protein n=1 Tax=Geomonas sp. RF6 TaxID=2897342 RepID=UPI001E52FEDA|nr:hypothetical protein [Geomonas sp. RF6]UFS69183.1 hypothetical protein LPW11_14915 [Geomonas sp. RF6]